MRNPNGAAAGRGATPIHPPPAPLRGPPPGAPRPVSRRYPGWVRATAPRLVRMDVKPNHISILGVGFAALSAACLFLVPAAAPAWRSILFIGAAALLPLPRLCHPLHRPLALAIT